MSDQLKPTGEDLKTSEGSKKAPVIVKDEAPTTEALDLAVSIKKGATLEDVANGERKNDENTKDTENLESKKARIDALWAMSEKVQADPELVGLFDRKEVFVSDKDPQDLLQEHGYPERTKISDLQFDTWKQNLAPKFVKDGHIYFLRGDHPNLENKGFYTLPYGYGQKTTEQLTHDLHASDEVGYFLYGNEVYLTRAKPSTDSIAQELAYKQSQIGGSSFVSGTTNLETAIAGTGNQPDPTEQAQYEVYVIKVPLDAAINSNTNNFFGMNETEYLVPDYISSKEIVAKFPRDNREGVYQYMHEQLGVTREDLGMVDNAETVSS